MTLRIFALIAVFALVQGPGALALSSGEADQRSKNVDLQLELLPDAMSGNSNLVVQLENAGQTDGAETGFAGLEPGMHTARVILMDEQNQPLQGGVAMVHFTVHAPAATVPLPQQMQGAPAPPPIPPELRSEGDPDIPVRSSPLLLVSIIGFALLIGGILPAIRSRKVAVHP